MYLIILLAIFGTLHVSTKAETAAKIQEHLRTLDQENANLAKENKELQAAVDGDGQHVDKEIEALNGGECPTHQTEVDTKPKRNITNLKPFLVQYGKLFRTKKGSAYLIGCMSSLTKPSTYSCVPHIGVTGIERISMPGQEPFNVMCDSTTAGSGWIVIQRRIDGKENFYRTWAEYKHGFGDMNKEFFLGLEYISKLTAFQKYELMVTCESFNGTIDWARYNNFVIGSERERYALLRLGKFSGTVDVLSRNLFSKFSTYDNESTPHNLSKKFHGGYWYVENYMQNSNLNGKYFDGPKEDPSGIHWSSPQSQKYVSMMIRPQNA